MPTIEQRLERLEDEAAIRELAARFADASSRNDIGTLKTLFTSDALFIITPPNAVTCHGVDEIAALIEKLEIDKDFFVQFVHSGLIQINGDKASARWIMHEMALSSRGKAYYNNFGFFHDELQKVRGEWLFSKRTYEYVYLDTDPFTGKAITREHEVSFT